LHFPAGPLRTLERRVMQSRQRGRDEVQFNVLGPVEARDDDRVVDLGTPRQRYVLGALLTEANQVIPPDELAARVWGEGPPLRAIPTLQSYLSRLRSLLSTPGGCEIHRRSGGYTIQVDEQTVDLFRFRRFSANARDTDDDTAAALLAEALGLWRGPVLAGLDTPWAVRAREAVHAEKLTAELDYYDVQLRRGEHAAVLAELTMRADEHPRDERLARQLLLALYRSGRQADALQRYEEVRLRLADELGADPGPELQQLHQQMLTAAPALGAVGRPRGSGVPVPRQLPAPPPVFTGRVHELAELDAALDPQNQAGRPIAISAVGGSGGIGKTCLALHWSYRHLDHFPDGQLYANLRGFDGDAEPVSPEVVIRAFLDGLGIGSEAIPSGLDAQAALYRSLVADKRMLVLLDNARDTDQVVPLLPGSPSCVVVVTSRQELGGLIATHGARPLTLDVLHDPEAHELLARHLGRARLDREPDAVADMVRSCAGLPLALSIVAARASTRPTFPLATVAEELRDTASRLDALDAGHPRADLRTVFSWSYQALRPEAARLFRLLGLHPGPDIDLPAAASLAGVGTREVRPLLTELTRASLLTEHRPGRFVLHDLLRAYAGERCRLDDTDAERHEGMRRALDHYLHTGTTAARLLTPTRMRVDVAPPAPGVRPEVLTDPPQAATWFGTERAVILAAIRTAAQFRFDTHCWQLQWAIGDFLDRHAHWHDYAAACDTALAAAQRLGSREAEALILRGLARACTQLGAYTDAQSHLDRTLDLYRQLDDPNGQATIHLAFGRLLEPQGHPAEALAHVRQALEIYRATGDRVGQAYAMNGIGWCHAQLGNYPDTLTFATEALRLAGEIKGCAVAGIWHTLGYAHLRLGQRSQAIDCLEQAVAAARERPDVGVEAIALSRLGEAYDAAGDLDAARASWRQALTIHCTRGRSRDAEAIERKLADSLRNP
jgi:DNA-binding SARP family transcriptional activator/tetratricopeptide (TPR) repeat protein